VIENVCEIFADDYWLLTANLFSHSKPVWAATLVLKSSSLLTRSSHKLVQFVKLPTFDIHHRANGYNLTDMRLNLTNNVSSHYVIAKSLLDRSERGQMYHMKSIIILHPKFS